MDEFLADLYGTNAVQEEDFEKVAHLDFLEKVAEEEGINLDDLSDEDLEELAGIAAEAMDEEGEYEEEEEAGEEDDFEKEAEAKVEEADFLGRVMAHSFTQEMDSIEMEKDAGARIEALKGSLRSGAETAKAVGSEVGGRAARAGRQAYREGSKKLRKHPLGRMGEASTLGGRMKARMRALGRKADKGVRGIGRRLGAEGTAAGARRGAEAGYAAGKGAPRVGKGRARRALDAMTAGRTRRGVSGAARGGAAGARQAVKSQRRRGYGALGAGAGAAALGGGAYAATREKKSADEAVEEAVQARAWEHLMAAGLADDEGRFIPAEDLDKTAADDELDYEIDAAALELLEAEGYPVEWY